MHDLDRYVLHIRGLGRRLIKLCRDGFWAPDEIEAIYGVHHVYSQKKSKVRLCFHFYIHAVISSLQDDEEHKKKADHIVNTVLGLVDGNKDGKVSLDEFKAVGLDGLPNFDDLGAEGHHYDVESGPCIATVSCEIETDIF